jgi:phosphoglycerate kinase
LRIWCFTSATLDSEDLVTTQLATLDDLGDLVGTRVFLRVDFNVPLAHSEGRSRVLDDTRLVEALPTIRELIGRGARLLVASHCGRPKGGPDPRYSLRPAADRLSELLSTPVAFAADCVGEPAQTAAAALADGGVAVLENLRFHAGEEANDATFAAQLAELASVYVDDAFGAAHRAHASVVGVPARVARRAAGRLVVREVTALARLLTSPARPFAALVGGAKIADKLDTLVNLLPRLDLLLLGGGMANTFLAARGFELRDSLVERDQLAVAAGVLADAEARGVRVLLPQDLVVAPALDHPAAAEVVAADAVPVGCRAFDIGPATRESFVRAIASAKTLFWNGPLGVFETPPFDAGTRHLAAALAALDAFTVVGGGETVAAVHQAGVADRIDHVSTGGGASLEFLAGKVLPGVAILERS